VVDIIAVATHASASFMAGERTRLRGDSLRLKYRARLPLGVRVAVVELVAGVD
jgi:hypothetical protein